MTNLIEDTNTNTATSGTVQTPLQSLPENHTVEKRTRPHGLPDKFWDEEKGEIRTGSLWRSYQALEQRFSRGEGSVPERHEDYCIECGDRQTDPEVNAILHRAGFSNDQAQLVYDLARHYVVPQLEASNKGIEAATVKGRLEEYFGGKERWSTVSRQLGDWGRAHLPEDVMEALGSSFEGIQALHRMMAADEPGIAGSSKGNDGSLDEKGLKKMMADPRYWRDQDKVMVDKVRAGFERLYPG